MLLACSTHSQLKPQLPVNIFPAIYAKYHDNIEAVGATKKPTTTRQIRYLLPTDVMISVTLTAFRQYLEIRKQMKMLINTGTANTFEW